MAKYLVLLGLIFATEAAAVQIASCSGPVSISSFFRFIPATPSNTQPFAIEAGLSSLIPNGLSVSADGNVITVKVEGQFFGVAGTPGSLPPTLCATEIVGPLAIGSYIVNFFAVDRGLGASEFLGTRTLVVTAATGPDLSKVPTLSEISIAALALLLSIAGWFALRRRAI